MLIRFLGWLERKGKKKREKKNAMENQSGLRKDHNLPLEYIVARYLSHQEEYNDIINSQ